MGEMRESRVMSYSVVIRHVSSPCSLSESFVAFDGVVGEW
jgi:hypothetical protein